MTNTTDDQICAGGNELVGFLYGELTEWETRKFERHMLDCTECRKEYAAFGQLRSSIVAWRDESLGRSAAPALAPVTVQPAKQRRPSALAAIREFISLSPVWLKGATAFASILFCLLATFAVANFVRRKNTNPPVTSDTVFTARQLKEAVDKGVQDRTAELEAQLQRARTVSTSTNGPVKQSGTKVTVKNSTSELAGAQKLRRPLSRQERQELAADLRLLSSRDDDGLDLVGDSINQKP